MKKYLAVLGLFCAASPLARADDAGVVLHYDGPRITFRMGLLAANIGEVVRLTVLPERREGHGQAVVTDVDRVNRTVGMVLLPLDGAGRTTTGAPETGTVHGGLRLFTQDMVRVFRLNRYMDNPPAFLVERPAPASRVAPVDIEMPYLPPALRGGASDRAPAAAPARGAATPMPDVDALLRNLEGHLVNPEGTHTLEDSSIPQPGANRPGDAEGEGSLQKVAKHRVSTGRQGDTAAKPAPRAG
jgi:hypothetical protein